MLPPSAAPSPPPDNTPEAHAARVQSDAAARVQRAEGHRALEREHPHLTAVAEYFKNFATVCNPKADTHPHGSGAPTGGAATGGTPANLDPTVNASPGPKPVDLKPTTNETTVVPATTSVSAQHATEPSEPTLARADVTAYSRPSGNPAAAAAIEELQSSIDALASA